MKAQVFTFDVFLSLMFFVSVFVIWLLITNQLVEQASIGYEISMLDKKLQRVSDLLIRSKGIPEDWNGLNVKALGLVNYTEYIVSFDKILNFFELSEEKIKSMLGLRSYNIYFKVTNLTGQDFPEGILEKGVYPSPDSKVVVSIKRYFIFDFKRKCENLTRTLFLDRIKYSPSSNIQKNYSAVAYAPTGSYTTITLYNLDTTNPEIGKPVYFYQNPPNINSFKLPTIPSDYYNASLYLKNIGTAGGQVYVRIVYYNSSGIYRYDPPNQLKTPDQSNTFNPGDERWEVFEWHSQKDSPIPPRGGLALEVWAYKSNFTLYFDGWEYPSNFTTPVTYPLCDQPPKSEIAMMQMIVWR
ncbi:MAG: hypothetical protein QW412_00665 [Candidatus Aenigmatarchaeota archaeon]